MRVHLGTALLCASISAICTAEEPVAAHAMVVTTTGAGAAQAGLEALKKGGNAMDAAMTAAMMQPCLAAGSYVSYAGILNVVYYEAASGKVFNLNAGFNTVLAETDAMTIPGMKPGAPPAGGLNAFDFEPSGRTALVPGFLAGVEAAQRRFGKMHFAEVVAPAIGCAEQGFVLTPNLAGAMKYREAVLQRLPETKAIFTKANGAPYAAGDRFRQPQLAATLRALSKAGVDAYIYRGAWAESFVSAVQRDGGKMSLADLKAYLPTWIEPVHGRYNGFDVYAHGLPSTGGLALIEGLNLATAARLAQLPPYRDSPLALFWLLQFSKVSTILSAPGVPGPMGTALGMDLSPTARLTQGSADKMWALLQAGRIPSIPAPKLPGPAHSDGVVAIDARGNVAAVVHSINTVNWGSTGIFVGGISIPDSAAFQQGRIAALPPGSRLPEDTNPGLVLRDGKPVLGFSVIGVGLNVRALAALVDTLGHAKTPHQAIASPSLAGFDWSKAATGGEIGAVVGVGELSADYRRQLRDLGQSTTEDDASRGYWIGISRDAKTHELRGGALREIEAGGGAAGY